MRGKDRQALEQELQERITPAHAGKREDTEEPKAEEEDHPRTCG